MVVAVVNWPSLVDIWESVDYIQGQTAVTPPGTWEQLLDCPKCPPHVPFLFRDIQRVVVWAIIESWTSIDLVSVDICEVQYVLVSGAIFIYSFCFQIACTSSWGEIGTKVLNSLNWSVASQLECWVLRVCAVAIKKLVGIHFSCNSQREEDGHENYHEYLEYTDHQCVPLPDPNNTNNRPDNNQDISSHQYPQNNFTLISISKKDLGMCITINRNGCHSNSYKKNKESSKTWNALETT